MNRWRTKNTQPVGWFEMIGSWHRILERRLKVMMEKVIEAGPV